MDRPGGRGPNVMSKRDGPIEDKSRNRPECKISNIFFFKLTAAL